MCHRPLPAAYLRDGTCMSEHSYVEWDEYMFIQNRGKLWGNNGNFLWILSNCVFVMNQNIQKCSLADQCGSQSNAFVPHRHRLGPDSGEVVQFVSVPQHNSAFGGSSQCAHLKLQCNAAKAFSVIEFTSASFTYKTSISITSLRYDCDLPLCAHYCTVV